MRVLQKHGWAVLLLSALFLFLGAQACRAEGGVSGLVWIEKNVDGVFSTGESGYTFGAKVTLERRIPGQEPTYINRVSDQSGNFIFSNVPAGEYRMRIEVSPDYRFTVHGLGSAALPAMGNVSFSPYFQIADGQTLTMNVGLTRNYCAVSLIAFVDENANGGRMQAEPTVRSVQADLIYEYGGETYVVASGTTNYQGELIMRDLSPATYRVRVTLPDNLVIGPLGQKLNNFYNCFYPNADNTGITAPFTLNAKESIGMGIGMVRTGSLTGKIWNDANFNGLWDSGEGGLPQATVTLYSPSLGLNRTAVISESGEYSFQGLQPGEYQLSFQLPQGMIFTYPGTSLISETADHATVNVSVQVDVTTNMGSVGAMPSAGLTLRLYQDGDLDGMPGDSDAPVPGAEVIAYQGGKAIETAYTDYEGKAVFYSLRGGDTVLSASLPAGYVFSRDASGLFLTSGAQTRAEASVFLDGTQGAAEYSAAVTLPVSISGTVFEDVSNSGQYREGGAFVPGFTVQAMDENGQTAVEAVTDANGAYTLSSLLPGTYTVRFLLTDDYVASVYNPAPDGMYNHISSQSPDFGLSEPVTLAPGQQAGGIDGGVFKAGRVDGYVYLDEEFAAPGTGMSGVSVILNNEYGQPASAYSYGVTDENGYFFIKGVLPGTYFLSYTMPANGQFTDPSVTDRAWATDSFQTESGTELHMPPIHGIYNSTLSGRIIYDGLETDSKFTAVLSLRGQNIRQAFQIHARPDGSYAFTGLKPDTYTLQVNIPSHLVFGQLEGSPIEATDETSATAVITFAMGESRTDADILVSLPVSVSGTVYYDDDLSGQMDGEEYGAEGRSLSLWRNGEEAASVYTDENGAFTLDHLIPADYELRIAMDDNEVLVNVPDARQEAGQWVVPLSARTDVSVTLPVMRYASVSGQVWSLDGSLAGVEGLAITLLDQNGATVTTVITDETGSYTFDHLTPGEYTLSTTLPLGHLFARDIDTSDRESYIQGEPDGTPKPIAFTVPMGDDLSGIDIGMGAMGAIGDRAWLDENGNGMQDIGESYMPGIRIQLYQYGVLIAETTTNEYGKYLISDIYPGEYEMHVTMHPELKTTVQQKEFPLVASIMPESKDTTVVVPGVIVPSGGQNLHCDLGFQLRKKNVYPEAMKLIPAKDWTPYSERQ